MTSSESRSTQPFQQLVADMVLWMALLLLFLAFRITLFAFFRGELSQLPSLSAFVRCLNTGLGSDATAATWAILPSLVLTIVGFLRRCRMPSRTYAVRDNIRGEATAFHCSKCV